MTGEGVAPVKGCGYNTVKVNGLHPMRPLGTGSTMRAVEVTVDLRMSMEALLIPTTCQVCKVEAATLYP